MRKISIILLIALIVNPIISQTKLENLDDLRKKYPGLEEYNEKTINLLGYRLIKAKNIGEAIEVFKLNTLLYPDSWNVYDSLGEAYTIIGEKELAIKNYTKSIQINPGNTNGRRMLGKLRHPELAEFTGSYEFYLGFRYIPLEIYVEAGNLLGSIDGDNPLTIGPIDFGKREFKSVDKDKTYFITFQKDERGKITRIEWTDKRKIFFAENRSPSVLKEKYSMEELKEDFLQFRSHIEEVHPCPYEFTTKESFDRLFEAQYEKIRRPTSLREFYNVLVPLKAKIGDGHAHLDYPAEYRHSVQVFKFPLILSFLDNRCYVIKNLNENSLLPLYSEILSINGIGIDELIKTLKSEISADGHNDFFKASALEDCFQYYYANHFGSPKEFRIEYRTEDSGDIQEAVIPALPCSAINYSNKEQKDLGVQILAQKNTAVMTINSFVYYEERNKIFFSFIDKAFGEIKEKNIENLIIDLRGNGGGDPFCASYLLAYIERQPYIYFAEPYGKYSELSKPIKQADNRFEGKLFFLIDGSNFSTTGHFCSILKYHNLGTFIGTETGGTYTCNADVRVFQLRNTRIGLKIATKSFAAAVEGFPKDRGIIPNHSVKTSIEDIKNGRDTVLDYALELIDKIK
jgi:tetratricopeptide (TPR) repeat protein